MDRDLGRHLLDPETRSPDPAVCPFLRAVAPSADGSIQDLLGPIEEPHDDNRCLAAGLAWVQGIDQQRVVCLTAGHISCARYLRGAAAGPLPPIAPRIVPPVMEMPPAPAEPVEATDPSGAPEDAESSATQDLPVSLPPAEVQPEPDATDETQREAAPEAMPDPQDMPATAAVSDEPDPASAPVVPQTPRRLPVSPRGPRVITPAVVVAIAILTASAALAIAFVGARGGLELPSASNVAVASPGPTTSPPTPVPTPVPTAEPTAASQPSSAPTPPPTPVPTTEPTAPPTATPELTPPPTATPAPTSDRYAVLVPCASTPSCYLYTIRAGDNLQSIAHWFGVPYSTMLVWNPQITDAALIHAGQVIRLPPPTR